MADSSNILFRTISRARNSMAFYPALIAVGYVVLAAGVAAFERTELASELNYNLPQGLTEVGNVRQILGTLITSIISLAVFSFSMVMVVLNGAAARLSPRVLPGLISDTRNRVILGIYLGSVLFYLIQIGLLNEAEPSDTPTLGTLLALATGMLCMVLFVVFIHSVSQSIQVEWIIDRLYRSACRALASRTERLRGVAAEPDDRHWWSLRMVGNGYLREVNETRLAELLCRRNLVARLQVEPGFFLVEGHPLLRLSEVLSEDEAREVLDCFHFHAEEFPEANATYGMRQISEIAVKAVSPAVNDPVTAVRAINLLGVLLGRHMGLPAFSVGCFDGTHPRLFYRELALDQLLYRVLAPIRSYGGHDPQILLALLQCLKNALHCRPDPAQRQAIQEELQALCEEAAEKVHNNRDRRAVNAMLAQFEALPGMTPLEPLST